ncbi:MAG: uncharacterized protein QOF48_814 [Verrucomicrobiota bacterium]|jgi:DNA ligase-associated metallophosphoesterase
MLEIECAGERLRLLVEKAVHWPRTRTLIVADLHLGKPAAFRSAGIAVPEYTTATDLERLGALAAGTGSSRIVVLGDFFHARAGLQAGMLDAVARWREQNAALELVLVPGNHDKNAGSPPEIWGISEVEDGWLCPPFSFCHKPQSCDTGYVMAGHLHPAIYLREKFGGGLRAPCFCFGPGRAILPAFGSFTGMSNMRPGNGDRFFAIGPGQVLEIDYSN